MTDYTKVKSTAEKKHKDFTDAVASLSVEEMKKRITAFRFHEAETERFLKENEVIVQARDNLKELTSPSKDTLKAIKEKTQYLIALIDEAGGDITGAGNS